MSLLLCLAICKMFPKLYAWNRAIERRYAARVSLCPASSCWMRVVHGLFDE